MEKLDMKKLDKKADDLFNRLLLNVSINLFEFLKNELGIEPSIANEIRKYFSKNNMVNIPQEYLSLVERKYEEKFDKEKAQIFIERLKKGYFLKNSYSFDLSPAIQNLTGIRTEIDTHAKNIKIPPKLNEDNLKSIKKNNYSILKNELEEVFRKLGIEPEKLLEKIKNKKELESIPNLADVDIDLT